MRRVATGAEDSVSRRGRVARRRRKSRSTSSVCSICSRIRIIASARPAACRMTSRASSSHARRSRGAAVGSNSSGVPVGVEAEACGLTNLLRDLCRWAAFVDQQGHEGVARAVGRRSGSSVWLDLAAAIGRISGRVCPRSARRAARWSPRTVAVECLGRSGHVVCQIMPSAHRRIGPAAWPRPDAPSVAPIRDVAAGEEGAPPRT